MKKPKFRKATFLLTICKDVVMSDNLEELSQEEFNKVIDSYFEELNLDKHGWHAKEATFVYNDNDEIKPN